MHNRQPKNGVYSWWTNYMYIYLKIKKRVPISDIEKLFTEINKMYKKRRFIEYFFIQLNSVCKSDVK